MKQSVAILDIGTSKVTVMIGSRGLNNSVCVDGIGISSYDGFIEGKWVSPEKLGAVIEQAVAAAESSARLKINKLYIGVPGDFLLCNANNVVMSLGKKRRVLDSDVKALHDQGNEYFSDPDWTVINIQPIYYTLDDEHKLIEPVGLSSTKLGGSISYILCDNEFIKTIDGALAAVGIYDTEYVSTALAETLFLFDDYKRDNCVMLADVGAIGTTLSIARGDGICRQYYFSWGGEHVTNALAESLEIPFSTASVLKKAVMLSLDPDYKPPKDDDARQAAPGEEGPKPGDKKQAVHVVQTEYKIDAGGEELIFNMAVVNNIVESQLRVFVKFVEKALRSCDYELPEYTALSVTGGGLLFRGATAFLAECLGREVEIVKPHIPLWDKPQLSAPLGLMDMVLSSESEYGGILGKLRRWVNQRRLSK